MAPAHIDPTAGWRPVTLHPFPAQSRMRWRRTDVPGHEEARAERVSNGWLLLGQLEVTESNKHASLRYRIECDDHWHTRSALIEGRTDRAVRFDLASDGHGHWTLDGHAAPAVTGAIDVDLGFTPMTNTLPIRRLELDVGDRAPVRSAWLRFPELRLETLEQTYFRETNRRFVYEALVDGEPFRATLDTDDFGRVLRYEGLWEIEFAEPGT
jgi:hypothetical protein